MANFHPSDNQLTEYSAGSLDWAVGILVSTHLSLCVDCRRKARALDCVGGALVAEGKCAEIKTDAFSSVMARIKDIESHSEDRVSEAHTESPEPQPALSASAKPNSMESLVAAGRKKFLHRKSQYNANALETIPSVVKKLLPEDRKIHWRRISPSLDESQLTTNQDKYKVCLHKIKRGGSVVEHDHNGLEITVVLSGSFSDESGSYGVGDFISRQAGQTHRPMASQNQDCLCLSLTDAPIKVTGLLGKVINPFLSFRPG